MTQEELASSTSYIDMVRNHREKAFDEGAEEMRSLYIADRKGGHILPSNPYRIEEKEKE